MKEPPLSGIEAEEESSGGSHISSGQNYSEDSTN